MSEPKELPGAVVGSGEPRDRKSKLHFGGLFNRIKRFIGGLTPHARVIVILVFVLILAGTVTALVTHKQQDAKQQAVCSDEILKQASTALAPTKTEQLKPVVTNIQALEGYETDANCLNVVTTYYVNTGDPINAQLYLDKLKAVYDPGKAFSGSLGTDVRTLSYLESATQSIRTAAEQGRKNRQQLIKGNSTR